MSANLAQNILSSSSNSSAQLRTQPSKIKLLPSHTTVVPSTSTSLDKSKTLWSGMVCRQKKGRKEHVKIRQS